MNNYYKKYLKYKTKYINFKQNILGGNDCSVEIEQLKLEMKNLALGNNISENELDKHIDDWFNGVSNIDTPLNVLLDPVDDSANRPLWWAGFNLSNASVKKEFNKFVNDNHFYTDCHTKIAKLTDNDTYSQLRSKCSDNTQLKNFELMVSKFFTLNALNKIKIISDPYDDIYDKLNLSLLVNKEINDDERLLQDSYFYEIELKTIIFYCIDNNKYCVLYLYNLKGNCGNIKQVLLERAKNLIEEKNKDKKNIFFDPELELYKYFDVICVRHILPI